jgi:hypothetical protein
MIKRYLPKSVSDLVRWYERYVSPIALVIGFLADNYILLRRVDLFRSNALLLSYLVIAAVGIVLINMIETGRIRARWMLAIAPLIPVIVQFSFGGLFSGYLSLYSRSAGFVGSWVFVLLVAGLLLGNERFMRLYTRFTFQIGLYFVVLFSFLIFFLPVIFHRIGYLMFFGSGVVALVVIAGFLYVLHRAVPALERKNRIKVIQSIGAICIVFSVLYFTNLIPPLPLALKDAGVYHTAVKVGNEYRFLQEAPPWYRAIFPYNATVHVSDGESLKVYTAIFAPTGLKTTILHEWQHYNEANRSWETSSNIQFDVLGGRDGGYRAYSAKTALAPGKWRVNVLTPYGQILGRVTFTVIPAISTPLLQEVVK